MVPSDSEDVSPNKVNLFRPRYTKLPLAILPEMVKPATGMEEINACTCQDGRGDWGERASKEQSWYLGDLFRIIFSEVERLKRCQGINNLIICGEGSRSGPYEWRRRVMPVE